MLAFGEHIGLVHDTGLSSSAGKAHYRMWWRYAPTGNISKNDQLSYSQNYRRGSLQCSLEWIWVNLYNKSLAEISQIEFEYLAYTEYETSYTNFRVSSTAATYRTSFSPSVKNSVVPTPLSWSANNWTHNNTLCRARSNVRYCVDVLDP